MLKIGPLYLAKCENMCLTYLDRQEYLVTHAGRRVWLIILRKFRIANRAALFLNVVVAFFQLWIEADGNGNSRWIFYGHIKIFGFTVWLAAKNPQT